MSGKGKKKGDEVKLLATNPNAHRNLFITETVEAGIQLTGTEIKSLRAQAPNLKDAFVEIQAPPGSTKVEAWLMNTHIAPYSHGNIWNHEPTRKRRLLLHRHQIEKLFGALVQKGMTLVPTKMYLKEGRAKLELGLGKGKKHHDKRDTVKSKETDREISQAMKRTLKD
ncbi:MAG: SsrA-binding protein SmpB [Bdellovibrionales bacterium]|nr:SsrA-binding protein SmpB [Bdellovibrionales bacterium]